MGNNRLLYFPVSEKWGINRDMGLRFYLDSKEPHITPDILTDNYERFWTGKFLENIDENSHIIDVGANIGWFSILAGTMMKQNNGDGSIVAIEPNRTSFELLNLNIESNHLSGYINTYNKAISSVPYGKVDFWQDEGFPAASHIQPLGTHPDYNRGGFITAEATSLDAVVDNFNLPVVDLVKIDVEGAEYEVWKGMTALVSSNPRLKLMIELHAYAAGQDNTEQLIMDVKKQGFNVSLFDRNGNPSEGMSRSIAFLFASPSKIC